MVFFLALFASVVVALPPIWDESCTYTRDDVYTCLKNNVDVNPKDDKITEQEIDEAFSRYVPWYVKPFLFVSRTSGATIIEYCDYDKNGVITKRDFYMANKTCLPDKRNWCTVQWFCER